MPTYDGGVIYGTNGWTMVAAIPRERPTAFGALLEHLRLAAGLSREALAERAGVSAAAIGMLERGERRAPHADTVRRLGTALALDATSAAALTATVPHHRLLRPIDGAPVASSRGAPLATPVTRLIGRERDLAAVCALCTGDEGRLVTLVGPAGVGKTRLALAVADRLAQAFPEPAFVDLSAVREPERVLDVVAARLDLQDRKTSGLDRLLHALQGRRLLLVLDNFEQVLPAGSELPALLAGAPGLRLLVTSRAPLGLRTEYVYVVPPLALPDLQQLPALPELAQVPAVQLYLERARAQGAGLELTQENAAAVAELCVRLDGLPLALELAAARTPLLSPVMILERLGQRLALLAWKAQDLPARQQTLAVALTWSYELLQEAEQALFRRLAVFAGGFTLEAAEAVAAGSGAAGVSALDGLATLVSGSLVVSEPAEGSARRYRLLESMRAYVLERLAEQDEFAMVHRAHADYYLRLTECAAAALYGPGQRASFLRLEHEQQNLHAALQWLADHHEGELLLRLATATGAFWSLRSNFAERRHWLGTALQPAPEAQPDLRLKALVQLGEMLSLNGEAAEARPLLQEALALAQVLDDASSIARCLINLGWCAASAGALDEAMAQIEAGLAAAQAAENGWLVALADMHRGALIRLQGQPKRALPWLEDALRGFRTRGDAIMGAVALSVLGVGLGEAGDFPRAAACFRECLEIGVQLEDPSLLNHAGDAIALVGGGAVAAPRRNHSRARQPNPLSGHPSSTGQRDRARTAPLDPLGGGYIDDEVLAEALGALEALARTRGLWRTPEQARRERLEVELRVRMGAERFMAAWERGRARSCSELVVLIRQVVDGLAAAPTGQPQVAGGTDDPLSPREREVLRLLAAGLSNRAIAAQLSVAERTAKHHLTGLFNKLGASSRTQALAVARERDLL